MNWEESSQYVIVNFVDQFMVSKTNYTIIARPYRPLNTKSLAMINLNMGLHHLTSSTGTPFLFFGILIFCMRL